MIGPRVTNLVHHICTDDQGNRVDVIEHQREFVGPRDLSTGRSEIGACPSLYELRDKTALERLDEVTFKSDNGRRFTRS